jgi:hypothetical protein
MERSARRFLSQEGLKVNTDVYIGLLEKYLKPWLIENYPNEDFVFQQDGAPAHTSHRTQAWFGENNIPFWRKELWPPSSPDLNPLDFSVWSVVESKACATSHNSVKALKASIT